MNNWITKRLDEVATVTMGQSPPSSSYNTEGAGVPFLQGTPPVVDGMGAAVPNQWTTQPAKVVEAGTALMTVRAPVGNLFTTNNSVCLGRGLAGIKANNDVSQDYLNYYLQFAKNQFSTVSQGSTFTAINSGDLKGIEVALPSYQNQKYFSRILSVIDQSIAKTDQIIQKIEALRKGLIKEFLSQGIENKKFKKSKVGEIPETWQVKSLSEVCVLITDGKHGDCKNQEDSGFFFISSKDIRDGSIHYTDARQITKTDFDDANRRTCLEVGDLVMTNSGTIGRMAIAASDPRTEKTTFQKSVAIIKPIRKLVSTEYLKYYFMSVVASLQITSNGSAQKNLLLKDLRSLQLPIPSVEEQSQIVSILVMIDQKLSKEKITNKQLLTLKRGLMQDIFSRKVEIN